MELMLVAFILSTLTAMGYLVSQEYIQRAKVVKAIADIRDIERQLLIYYGNNGKYPPTLADVGEDSRRDPWDALYDYWPITGDPKQKVRKDRNLHPLNTDFDLGSRGRNGVTSLTLTTDLSQDDVIRANNGAFVGLASKY